MGAVQHLPVAAPIVGVRLHSRQPAAGTPAAARVEWLLSLADRERERVAAVAALKGISRAAQQALAAIPGAVGARLDEVAGIAVELGLAIAREVVGAALDQGLVDPTPTVARCLRDCVRGSDCGELTIRVHPDDLALVLDRLSAMPELREQLASTQLVADASLARGAVRAETEAGRLRYDPREALERVCAEVHREVHA